MPEKQTIVFVYNGKTLNLTMIEAADWQIENLPEESWLTSGGIASRMRNMVHMERTTRQVMKIDKCPDGRLKNRGVNKNQGKIEICLVKEKFSSMVLVPVNAFGQE